MIRVILPTGYSVQVDELSYTLGNGYMNLAEFLNDLQSNHVLDSYKIKLIKSVKQLGDYSKTALEYLSLLAKNNNALAKESKLVIDDITKVRPQFSNRFHPEVSLPHRDTIEHIKRSEKTIVTLQSSESTKLDDGVKGVSICNFCCKLEIFSQIQKHFLDILVNNDKFYCQFCLKNEHYKSYANKVFALSFRGIIGYYYYCYYNIPKQIILTTDELRDLVETHRSIGNRNPVFRYDYDSMIWFIDFNKVGKSGKKLSVNSVLETLIEIICSFNIYDNVPGSKPYLFYKKIENEILRFYQQKTKNEKVFVPQLDGCGLPEHKYVHQRTISLDTLKYFSAANFLEKSYVGKGRRIC